MSIKELVSNNKVRFNYYRKGELWYDVIETTYEARSHIEIEKIIYSFPVPIEDCGDGRFESEDKAILFMRYIRKQMESEDEGRSLQS